MLLSRDANDVGTRVVLLAGFVVTILALTLALTRRRQAQSQKSPDHTLRRRVISKSPK